MTIEQTPLKDCFILHDTVHGDARGYFIETYNSRDFKAASGLDIEFVQDNQSKSSKGVIRGLHMQRGAAAQAKLVRVLEGAVLDVAVDLRQESKTFGQHVSVALSEENKKQLFIPRGFAHGFIVLSESATISYKVDAYYAAKHNEGIAYNDPDINIDWGFSESEIILSEADKNYPTLAKSIKLF